MMLIPDMFEKILTSTQIIYRYSSKKDEIMVQIVSNKSKEQWFAMYYESGRFPVIPINEQKDHKKVLVEVCNWYNSVYQQIKSVYPTIRVLYKYTNGITIAEALKIQSYLENPTLQRWTDIKSIKINAEIKISELIRMQLSKRYGEINDHLLEDIIKGKPDPFLVLSSIKQVIKKKKTS